MFLTRTASGSQALDTKLYHHLPRSSFRSGLPSFCISSSYIFESVHSAQWYPHDPTTPQSFLSASKEAFPPGALFQDEFS